MTVQITVYSRPDCQPCKATIRKLDKLGATYIKIDVSEDAEALDLIKGLGYSQAPVVTVGDEHWTGYKPHHLEWAAQYAADA